MYICCFIFVTYKTVYTGVANFIDARYCVLVHSLLMNNRFFFSFFRSQKFIVVLSAWRCICKKKYVRVCRYERSRSHDFPRRYEADVADVQERRPASLILKCGQIVGQSLQAANPVAFPTAN